MDWHEYFIRQADLVSTKSKDRSTKVGAVIIGPDNEIRSTGFNGFPRGVVEDLGYRHERPLKYRYFEHAERNAIFNAARHGVSLKGCTMYLNYEPLPCCDCTRAVIQTGIIKVVGPDRTFGGKGDHWSDEMKTSDMMLREAGIELIYYNNILNKKGE